MTVIYSGDPSLTEKTSYFFQNGFHLVSRWANHVFTVLQHLSQHMQNHHRVAIGVFTIANAFFFTVTYLFASWLNRRVEDSLKKLDAHERNFNHFLINVVVTGCCILILNIAFSRIIKYPLSKRGLTMITLTAIAMRVLSTNSTKIS